MTAIILPNLSFSLIEEFCFVFSFRLLVGMLGVCEESKEGFATYPVIFLRFSVLEVDKLNGEKICLFTSITIG